jgi:hypothetical protein
MPKVDDTNTIPETITAPWLKRFFKAKFGITIRVRTMAGVQGGKKHISFIEVWIPGEQRFPAEFGNRCMRAVYPHSETLREQNWGGNISGGMIAMSPGQWRLVLRTLIECPIAHKCPFCEEQCDCPLDQGCGHCDEAYRR